MLEQVAFAGRVGLKDESLCNNSGMLNKGLWICAPHSANSVQKLTLLGRATLLSQRDQGMAHYVPRTGHHLRKSCLVRPNSIQCQVDQDFCWMHHIAHVRVGQSGRVCRLVCVCLQYMFMCVCLVWMGSRLAFRITAKAQKGNKDSPIQFAWVVGGGSLTGTLEQTHQGPPLLDF